MPPGQWVAEASGDTPEAAAIALQAHLRAEAERTLAALRSPATGALDEVAGYDALSQPLRNALVRAGITETHQLLHQSPRDLLRVRGLGLKGIQDPDRWLSTHGLGLNVATPPR